MKLIYLVLVVILYLIQNSEQQTTISNYQVGQTPTGAIPQTIYQFLQSLQSASSFVQQLNRIAQDLQDSSIINALQGNPSAMYQSQYGYTVFVPVNEALVNVPNDPVQRRNDFSNFIVKERMTLDRLRELNGRNLSSTFGIMPRLYVKVVRNFYRRQLSPAITNPTAGQQGVLPPGGVTPSPTFNQNLYPNQQNNQNNNLYPQQPSYMNNNTNIYNMYNQMFGTQSSQYSGPPISLQFPQDELFLINDAILLDRFELSNGVVFLMSTYPRYYDQSLLQLLQSGSVPSLGPNLNFLQSEAIRARRAGNDNLENALKVVGPNTYFLPSDGAFQKFSDREKLQNFTFLYEILFKSHRVSNQILFDYYLDGPDTYYTDTLLPINTVHRRNPGSNVDEIEVSIGHVQGKIIPELRNIFCFSGIIHVVDTVMGVPTKTAYQEMMTMTSLGTFRQLIDRSARYRQLLDQQPINVVYPTQPPLRSLQQRNQRQKRQLFNNDIRFMTILAPNDAALFNVRDILLQNDTALDQFLSTHIIIDNDQNRMFYTDHDQHIFQNGQRYTTLNTQNYLVATVTQSANEIGNRVSFQVQGRTNLQTRIVDGNSRTSNGVIHIVDRPLIQYVNPDLVNVLDRYATSSGTTSSSTSFSQFLDALKATGIYNELKSPTRQFTLFIPTNDALSRFQSIVNSNDMNLRRQILLNHIAEGLMLNKENTSELADSNKEIELRKNSKIKIERPDNNQDTYIVTNDGSRVRVLEHLEADNGNIFLIDNLLHTPNSAGYSNHLHGYGRNSLNGDSHFFQSKAYDFNTAAYSFKSANLMLYFIIIIIYVLFL